MRTLSRFVTGGLAALIGVFLGRGTAAGRRS